jgi:hypothetical protein
VGLFLRFALRENIWTFDWEIHLYLGAFSKPCLVTKGSSKKGNFAGTKQKNIRVETPQLILWLVDNAWYHWPIRIFFSANEYTAISSSKNCN